MSERTWRMLTNLMDITLWLLLALVITSLTATCVATLRAHLPEKPTPELPTSMPTILVQMDDPFPCLDQHSRTLERQACQRLGCICSPSTHTQ